MYTGYDCPFKEFDFLYSRYLYSLTCYQQELGVEYLRTIHHIINDIKDLLDYIEQKQDPELETLKNVALWYYSKFCIIFGRNLILYKKLGSKVVNLNFDTTLHESDIIRRPPLHTHREIPHEISKTFSKHPKQYKKISVMDTIISNCKYESYYQRLILRPYTDKELNNFEIVEVTTPTYPSA
ncbi:MAG: hypothetical protein ABRQ39_27625 [Candidatus Eremiobacterota bacterium]